MERQSSCHCVSKKNPQDTYSDIVGMSSNGREDYCSSDLLFLSA